jgi:hypothetical protein
MGHAPYRDKKLSVSFRAPLQPTRNTVVVAPTGITALNAGGLQFSMFQLPFGGFIQITSPQFSESLI